MRIKVVFVSLAFLLSGCGTPTDPIYTSGVFPSSTTFAGRCAAPRSGINPATGTYFADYQGSSTWENFWLRSWTNELYLWYNEVPDTNPAGYAPLDYFGLMKTRQTTPSGRPKDRFHFTIPSDRWYTQSQSGLPVSYGIGWAVLVGAPPRQVVVAYIDKGAPASIQAQNIPRGATVLSIDGVDMVNGSNAAALNAGLFPSTSGESHTFVIEDTATSSPRTITLMAAIVPSAPAQVVTTLTQGNAKIGYILFNHLEANAESNMISAINTLLGAGVADLVLDLRYNGGGFLIVASEVAYMIAGPGPTSGKTFEAELFNDKITPLSPVLFQATTSGVGSSLPSGQSLPHLNLPRVFVITTSNTCSASESIINGLRGVNVSVIQIGTTTCGKPYGFFPADNCGTTYFSIQLRGVNAQGFGDFPDGFAPANSPTAASVLLPGCTVADDYTHALGDPNEAMLAAALQYRANSTCPALPKAAMHRAVRHQVEDNEQAIRIPEIYMNKFY